MYLVCLPEKKGGSLAIPDCISNSSIETKQWFLRGLFDADGDTRATEAGFKSQARIKLRMKQVNFLLQVKGLLNESFSVSINGPYIDKGKDSGCIQVEKQVDILRLFNSNIFTHPVKVWRLGRTANHLLSQNKTLKSFASETISMGP